MENENPSPSSQEQTPPAPQPRNVVQEYEDAPELPREQMVQSAETVPLLATTRENAARIIEENTTEAERVDTEAARRWRGVMTSAWETVTLAKQFEELVAREGTEFKQYLQGEKGKLGFSTPQFAEKEGVKVSGEKALFRVRSMLGRGGLITIPLWHSGFWVTIKTPSDSALLELKRRLVEEKIALGRSTQALAFSNTQSYTTGWILDLVIEHLYETTLKDSSDLRKMILSTDLPVLFWGLACAIWPKGFQYARAALDPKGLAEKKLITGLINVSKLMWVDNKALTAWQKSHMSNRVPGTVSADQIERYRNEFVMSKGRQIELNENLKINLQVPSSQAYVQSGHNWISNLVMIVDSTFTSDRDDPESRNRSIAEHAKATMIRQYGHWVQSILVDNSEIDDEETITSILDSLSEDDDIRKSFLAAVNKFIDDVTIAVIAIPEASEKESGLPRFPRLIPLDVVGTFFILLMQRVNRITTR